MVKTIQKYTPEMERLLIHPGEIDEQLDFQRLFGNTHPVEIEIGMGKGRFLLAESLCRPDTNFIGIEWSLKWLRVALYRLAKAPRPNCLLLCLNADMVVKLLIPPRSVTAYHVYFPDPWPKEKHQKRRLFNPRFIEKLAETLVPHGVIYLKTDHEDYYNDTHPRIMDSGLFAVAQHTVSQPQLDQFEQASQSATHYEIKWALEARNLYATTYQKMA